MIDESVKNGDYVKAAQYEVMRNDKIDGENLNYEKTNKYKGWLDSTDYGTVLQNQMKSGASKNAVASTLGKRVKKASGTEGLIQFAYDDIYDSAIEYIKGKDEDFQYKKSAPSYNDKYSSVIKNYINELMNYDQFSYSPYDDDLYGYYKDEYKRRGERAMEDTLGAFAVEKIPELYKLAYGRYLDGIERDVEGIKQLSELSNEQYKRYYDTVKSYEADREFEYGKYKDAADEEYLRDLLGQDIYESDRKYFRDVFESNRDYDMEMQKYSRDIFESDREYDRDIFENDREYDSDVLQFNEKMNMENEKLEFSKAKAATEKSMKEKEMQYDSEQDLYELALQKWETLGYLDPESAKILGLPAGTKSADYLHKQAQIRKLSR